MLIVKTPFRISLFGGGTDVPAFFTKKGGQVLGFAIKKFSYVTVRELPPFYNHSIRLSYSKIERCNKNNEITHPLIRAALTDLSIKNIEIHHDSDLPGKSGVGSSSSFAVGLAHSLYAYQSRKLSPKIIADKAIYWERQYLKEKGGYQDQLFAAYGGFNHIRFNQDGEYEVDKLKLSEEFKSKLKHKSLLCYVPCKRLSYLTSVENYIHQKKTIENLLKIKKYVNSALSLFNASDIEGLGHLLNESWHYKRQLPDVSNGIIDEVYDKAINNGALGGKLLGAGKGGFMFFICKEESKKDLVKSLTPLITLEIDISEEGSKIIYPN